VLLAVELVAFTLPGALALAGYAWACCGLLFAYWVAHALGAPSRYRAWKLARSRAPPPGAEDGGGGEPENLGGRERDGA
jgi:hypothetical protein